MTLSIALELAIKSIVAAGIIVLLLDVLRSRSASERSWLAHFGLAAALVVPLAGEFLPRWYLSQATPAVADASTMVADTVWTTAATTPVPAVVTPVIDWDAIVGIAYALPAIGLLGVTLVAVFRLFALRRRSTVLIDEPWLAALAHAQRRMGFKNGAALLVSPELVSPVSWGLFRPTILVGEASGTGRDDAEAIIAHELAHVERFDWMKLLLARAVTAVLWFNPFVWLLARRCHQLREEAADDAVLRSDVNGTDYAQLLVSAARHESRGLLLAANGVAPSRASLGNRVRRVLDGSTARAPARLGWSLACIAIGMAIGAPLAALTARSAPVETASASPRAHSVALPSHNPVRIALSQPTPPAPLVAPTAPVAPVAPSAIKAPSPISPISPVRPVAAPRPVPVPEDPAVDARPAAYAGLSARELMILGTQGVSPEWVRDMRALGYRDQSFGSLMAMAVQGITPAYVRELAAAGYPGLSSSQLINMRIHGVDGTYIRRIVSRWGFRPSARDLVTMKITGFDAAARQPPEPPRPAAPPVPARVLN